MLKERHYFPGNNTPQGFFSYYRYILGQREANRIICIKGGPGSGKSTFIKKICNTFAEAGENIDYLHCSADYNSLDGAVIKGRRIALIDGTAPHITDPITPGAVDKIVNLGEFWNEDAIAEDKERIISLNEKTSYNYSVAYNYLNAAQSVARSLESIYEKALENGEIYRVIAEIIASEYRDFPMSIRSGQQKKSFISAVTADGVVHYLDTMVRSLKKIYLISVPEGCSIAGFMEILKEGAIYRGFEVETYYCPMNPENDIEHLIIPQLSLAFVTVNSYHDIEPWEIVRDEGDTQQLVLIDVKDYMRPDVLEKDRELTELLLADYRWLMEKGMEMLKAAQQTHIEAENLYIPNMNFGEISKMADILSDELLSI